MGDVATITYMSVRKLPASSYVFFLRTITSIKQPNAIRGDMGYDREVARILPVLPRKSPGASRFNL